MSTEFQTKSKEILMDMDKKRLIILLILEVSFYNLLSTIIFETK